MSYQISPEQALKNAGRLVQEGGAHAVKLEGGVRSAKAVAAIVHADIPVIGHIGLTPQSVRKLGGFRVQRDAKQLQEDAQAVADAGAFAIVLECVPAEIAARITQALPIPTIGIGAGANCDGQVLVLQDMLGMFDDLRPKFVKSLCRTRHCNSGRRATILHGGPRRCLPDERTRIQMKASIGSASESPKKTILEQLKGNCSSVRFAHDGSAGYFFFSSGFFSVGFSSTFGAGTGALPNPPPGKPKPPRPPLNCWGSP